MRRFRVALLTAAMALVAPAAAADERIVGGQEIDIADAPWALSLQDGGEHFCGAVIVSEQVALTAAHCLDDRSADALSVRAGSALHAANGHVRTVDAALQHPRYDIITTDYDVAVLHLSDPLPLGNPGVAAARVAREEPAPGTPALVVGWGNLSETGPAPLHLRGVEVPVVDDETCQASYGDALTARMLCAGYPEGMKDACQGDSGGPLADGRTVVGLVSWGHGCARPEFYGVYTHLAQPGVRAWVEDEAGV